MAVKAQNPNLTKPAANPPPRPLSWSFSRHRRAFYVSSNIRHSKCWRHVPRQRLKQGKPSMCPQASHAHSGRSSSVWSGLPLRVSGPQCPRGREGPEVQPSYLVGLLPGQPWRHWIHTPTSRDRTLVVPTPALSPALLRSHDLIWPAPRMATWSSPSEHLSHGLGDFAWYTLHIS